MLRVIFFLISLSACCFALSDRDLDAIGRRVWQNECGGTRDGLTSWNAGENFGSFGIGHFIWYPAGQRGPFEESFPKLMRFFSANGVKVPAWLEGDCPWRSRGEFEAARGGERMKELRDLLAGTIRLQSRFLAERMQAARAKIMDAAPAAQRESVGRQFDRLAGTGSGTYALIDYVNFKGEGTNPSERYHGEGWGLLQVLAEMRGSGPGAAREFGAAAATVLKRRVRNSPPERGEGRWLAGWENRVRAYGE